MPPDMGPEITEEEWIHLPVTWPAPRVDGRVVWAVNLEAQTPSPPSPAEIRSALSRLLNDAPRAKWRECLTWRLARLLASGLVHLVPALRAATPAGAER
jgi:hypothetical protein